MGSELSAESWPPPPRAPAALPAAAVRREMDAVRGEIAALQRSALEMEAKMDGVTTERVKFEALAAMLKGKGDGGVFTAQPGAAAEKDAADEEGEEARTATPEEDAPPSEPKADKPGDGEDVPPESNVDAKADAAGEEKDPATPTSPAADETGASAVPTDEVGVKEWLLQLLKDNIIVYLTRRDCPFSNDARQMMDSAQITSYGFELNIDDLKEQQCDALIAVVEDTYQQYGFPVIWITGELHELARLKELHKEKRLTAFVEARKRAVDLSRQGPTTHYLVEAEEEEDDDASEAPSVLDGALPDELVHLHPDAPLCLDVVVEQGDARKGRRASKQPPPEPEPTADGGDAPALPVLGVDRTNLFAALGAKALWSLVATFAELLAKRDDVYSMYRGRKLNRQVLVDRYTAFLCERLGGPPGMSSHAVLKHAPSVYCCPALLYMKHEGLPVSSEAATVWLETMLEAIHVSGIPDYAQPLLEEYFRHTVFHLRRSVAARPGTAQRRGLAPRPPKERPPKAAPEAAA
eukprot:TRINITY_DN4057_c0_g3_i1.p1 TRINITY_DN4057_c0_g3~~TRINITY_DN4057_c0_g3_i1.p1  ORF type:complete len:522 (+),score=210.64 TRINITY_DN4057_c0_g3_i1:108-1673(+)